MLGLTCMFHHLSSSAICSRRLSVQTPQRPVGSPTVASLSSSERTFRSSAVFFDLLASSPTAPHSLGQHLFVNELAPSPCDGILTEPEELSQFAISTVPQLQTLQPGEEPSLLLIQETVEEHNGTLDGLVLLAACLGKCTTGSQLLLTLFARRRGVKIEAFVIRSMNPSGLGQLSKHVLDGNVETGFQLGSVSANGGLMNKCLGGVQQRAVLRKPGPAGHPETALVELDNRGQGVVSASMGVAGEVVERSELSENGHVDLSSQGLLHLRHGDSPKAFKAAQEGFRVEVLRTHNVRITPIEDISNVILTF